MKSPQDRYDNAAESAREEAEIESIFLRMIVALDKILES